MVSNFEIYKGNCFYNKLTKHVHICIDFTCDSVGITNTIFKVPDNLIPKIAFSGIALKANGSSICNIDIHIDQNGNCYQGISNGLTSGTFLFDYYLQ